ncbi:trigger factor [Subtercola boreus]|uniref:trigger factor n=1 Tax=Subtercola boreus TaxID=120213 RepID=UPI00155935C8|nr:trigger factor [Subtercola boreus]
MKTTVEQLSPTRVKLEISVTPEELKPSIDHAYSHIAEQVNIPGFRKGKVPPPLIDQRVGKDAVLEHAVNDGLDGFYRAAISEKELRPLGRPEADIVEWPSNKDFTGDLQLAIEVDVRPELDLPDYAGLPVTVDPLEVSDEEVDAELEKLRTRFGTLITVDRPIKTGDFAQIDLIATIDDNEVDNATGISYEVGSGELLEGLDGVIDSLTAGETTSFEAPLLGGEFAGKDALVTVTINSVKERELPEADDDFAQISSEFDTIDELKADLKTQVERQKSFTQVTDARTKTLEALLALVEVPVPPKLIEDEVHRHLENESRLEDDEHRAEVTESSTSTFKTQILLDVIAEKEEVKVSQDELSQYLIQSAAQYGMEPQEFVKVLDENGQIPAMVGEVARNKALAIVLDKAVVTDTNGKSVDVSEFTSITRDADQPFIAVDGSSDDDDSDAGDREGHDHAGHDHAGHSH